VTLPEVQVVRKEKEAPCMFTLDAPFSSIYTRREYRPIALSVQPVPGAYTVTVVANATTFKNKRELKKHSRLILQAGREWRFHD
jgi:hypothetical protein